MDRLDDEIREDYLLQIKRAIIEFVLKDPADPNIDGLHKPEDEQLAAGLEHRQELALVPKPWNKSFLASQSFCRTNLHFSNPAMMQILDLWFSQYKYVDCYL